MTDNTLILVSAKGREQVRAIRTAGPYLVVESSNGQKVITEWTPTDRAKFHEIHERLSGGKMATWDDGTQADLF